MNNNFYNDPCNDRFAFPNRQREVAQSNEIEDLKFEIKELKIEIERLKEKLKEYESIQN